ncbi:MAG: hypothetical protein ABSG30_00170 [Steroidobacteraceae bacterium]|jgi:hypothetical protein
MRGAARNDGANVDGAVIESDVPGRMDRLPWSRWHLRIIVALGTSWILDGLEVTLVGSLSGVLESKNGLSLSDQQVTGAATVYLAGAVIGALLFGRLTDHHGRRRLFLATLATLDRDPGHGVLRELPDVRRRPIHHGTRYRRRVRRHQFGGRRAHPR